MTPEPCPTCKGNCCGYTFDLRHKGGHKGNPFHYCPDCDDGTYEVCSNPEPFVPPRTAEDERGDVLAWLRANTCGCHNFAGDIERGEHVGWAKKPSDKV